MRFKTVKKLTVYITESLEGYDEVEDEAEERVK